jgi:hypothetical protein
MQLHGQLQTLGRLEHPRRLLAIEGDALHERIDCIRQSFAGNGRQHVPANALDVCIIVALRFRRQRMCAEERCGDRDRAQPGHRAGGTNLPRLGIGLQSIPGFNLDGGDTLGDQYIETRQHRCDQLVLGRGTRRLDCGENAAACARDLLVAGAGQPQLELVSAITGVDEVCVAIDQSRCDPTPGDINPLVRLERRHV